MLTMQAYHSNSFVGNHIAKLFSDPQFTSVLHEYPDEHKLFWELFTRFSVLHKILGAASFFSDDEITKYSHACWDFGAWYPHHFPNENITCKLHILIFHTPVFLERWKSIGIFGEHGF